MRKLSELFKKPKDERQFKAFWGEGYSLEMTGGKNTLIVSFDFFTEDKGYSPEDIENINCLELNETLDLTAMGAVHTVQRTY